MDEARDLVGKVKILNLETDKNKFDWAFTTRHDTTRHDTTRQDKTRQDKTRQDKTRRQGKRKDERENERDQR